MQEQLAAGGHRGIKAKTLPTAAELVSLSQELLDAARNHDRNPAALGILKALNPDHLEAVLTTDAARKAFWINVYNALNLHWMPTQGDWGLNQRIRHFFQRKLELGGGRLSLNDIEHRILRRSRIWWARGWSRHPFPKRWEKQLRVDQLDPRIHFALNCGANSCPAIRHYSLEGVEAELEMATVAFLQNETEVEEGKVMLSSLFRMYLGDFGGRAKLLIWLEKYLPEVQVDSKIRYRPYDWTPNLNKWAE
ncbi:MAG: DUF547 domain-containing protein [Bacteroidia bacterium]